MYLSQYIRILKDIKAERDELEERRRFEEEQAEIEKLAHYGNGTA